MIPEINAEAARCAKKKLIANPNCTTAIALMALAPLHAAFGIKRCIMSTYQARPRYTRDHAEIQTRSPHASDVGAVSIA